MRLIPYNDSYFDQVVHFLKKNWAPNHAIYDKKLFDWQYRVEDADNTCSQLLVLDNQIIGFLGNIPGYFSLAGEKIRGVGLTMWAVDQAYRETGLGIRLLIETEKSFPVTYTLGCGPQVVPVYKRMGYTYVDALNRYVLPLDSHLYCKLLQENVDQQEVDVWISEIPRQFHSTVLPNENVSLEHLELLYKNTIQQQFEFSQYRDEEYWNWRYKNSYGFRYHFLGDPMNMGIAVVRVDRIYDPDNHTLHGIKVLRIIELLPTNGSVWSGERDESFISLLQGILHWAKGIKCVAVDFQISNNRLEHMLFEVGFKKQNIDYTPSQSGLAGLFQPYRLKVNRINLTWKIPVGSAARLKDVNDTYFVKSDCDMDRPNIWPLPEGWSS